MVKENNQLQGDGSSLNFGISLVIGQQIIKSVGVGIVVGCAYVPAVFVKKTLHYQYLLRQRRHTQLAVLVHLIGNCYNQRSAFGIQIL